MSGAQPCYWLLIWWPVSTQLRPHRIELISNRQMLGLWSWPGLKWIQNRIFEQDLGPRLRLFWDLQGRGASFILQALIFDPLPSVLVLCVVPLASSLISPLLSLPSSSVFHYHPSPFLLPLFSYSNLPPSLSLPLPFLSLSLAPSPQLAAKDQKCKPMLVNQRVAYSAQLFEKGFLLTALII